MIFISGSSVMTVDSILTWSLPLPVQPCAIVSQPVLRAYSTAVRDARGNALGGIRLAEHAVPIATNTGLNSGAGFCRLFGSHEPFGAPTIDSLYPTHAAYVAAVRDVTERNLKAGYILKVDADQTIAAAERSDVGRK